MKVNWPGIVAVAFIVTAITGYKVHPKHATVAGADGLPRVLLVADLTEADSEDACAEIIHSVRAARQRGFQVQEVSPDSKSEILMRYRILTIPTVLILDREDKLSHALRARIPRQLRPFAPSLRGCISQHYECPPQSE